MFHVCKCPRCYPSSSFRRGVETQYNLGPLSLHSALGLINRDRLSHLLPCFCDGTWHTTRCTQRNSAPRRKRDEFEISGLHFSFGLQFCLEQFCFERKRDYCLGLRRPNIFKANLGEILKHCGPSQGEGTSIDNGCQFENLIYVSHGFLANFSIAIDGIATAEFLKNAIIAPRLVLFLLHLRTDRWPRSGFLRPL